MCSNIRLSYSLYMLFSGNGSWIPVPQLHDETPTKEDNQNNIKDDPKEKNDLSNAMPAKVRELLNRFAYCYFTDVPVNIKNHIHSGILNCMVAFEGHDNKCARSLIMTEETISCSFILYLTSLFSSFAALII